MNFVGFRKPRVKKEPHLRFIRGLPCCVCLNNIETQAAHVRFSIDGKMNPGIQQKPDDKWTVPLCGRHHTDQHKMEEQAFWLTVGIDPIKLAGMLFAVSGNHEAGEHVVLKAARGEIVHAGRNR